MRITNLFRKNYLDWNEYQELIQEREQIYFLHNTALQSLKNKAQKEDDSYEN